MPLGPETITQQVSLLKTHRQILALLLQQHTLSGGATQTVPSVISAVNDARTQIAYIKATLRANDISVEDEPIDIELDQLLQTDDINISSQRNINTGGGDYAEGNIDKRHGGTFIEDSIVLGDIIGQQTITQNYYQASNTPLDGLQQRNRRVMLSKIKTIWVEGLLEQSLAEVVRIDLGLVTQPNTVFLPLTNLVRELSKLPRSLPLGVPIIDVFKQLGGTLLILGAPGSGKTTLLLELVRDLIAQVEQDDAHPIPVVFNLSSWAEHRYAITEWLVDELNTQYDVPLKVGREWVMNDALLPLLDGLDEVRHEYRSDCVEAINTYRQEHGLVPIAVCSRLADYEALTVKLRLQGAIAVQPLTTEQIRDYLVGAGKELAGLSVALEDDSSLRELAETPLMLSVLALAYQGTGIEALQASKPIEQRRGYLLDQYILRMFDRRGNYKLYTLEQTRYWLAWLANLMSRQGQTIFHMERLQPQWLQTQVQRWQYDIIMRLVVVLSAVVVLEPIATGLLGLTLGLVFASVCGIASGLAWESTGRTPIRLAKGLTFGLAEGLVAGLARGLLFGLVVGLEYGVVLGFIKGLATGLATGVITGLAAGMLRTGKVEIVETVRWSRPTSIPRASILGLSYGLTTGLAIGVTSTPLYGLISGLMAGLITGLAYGMTRNEMSERIRPNQGILRSARNGIYVGLASGFIYTFVVGLGSGLANGINNGLAFGLNYGPSGGLITGLIFGGFACIQHFTLRFILYRNGYIPWNYARFLDHATERILMRRVGGGYIFIHRLLQEHFAGIEHLAADVKYTEELLNQVRIRAVFIILSITLVVGASMGIVWDYRTYSEARTLVDSGIRLAKQGQVQEAIAVYKEANNVHPRRGVSASDWNNLCWWSTLEGHATEILYICEYAVALAPDDGAARDSRGLARALVGNYQGAIEDFQFYIRWSRQHGDYSKNGQKRESWVAKLRAGQNPFDLETLRGLKEDS